MSYLTKDPAILKHRLEVQQEKLRHIFTGNKYASLDQGEVIVGLLHDHIEALRSILDEADAELGQQFPEEEPTEAPHV